jgi:hypothetical protein
MDERLALRVVELRAQHAGFVAFVDMRFESLTIISPEILQDQWLSFARLAIG